MEVSLFTGELTLRAIFFSVMTKKSWKRDVGSLLPHFQKVRFKKWNAKKKSNTWCLLFLWWFFIILYWCAGCFFTSTKGLQSFEHPLRELKAMPRVDSQGEVCGANFKVDVDAKKKDTTMPRVGSAADWSSHYWLDCYNVVGLTCCFDIPLGFMHIELLFSSLEILHFYCLRVKISKQVH